MRISRSPLGCTLQAQVGKGISGGLTPPSTGLQRDRKNVSGAGRNSTGASVPNPATQNSRSPRHTHHSVFLVCLGVFPQKHAISKHTVAQTRSLQRCALGGNFRDEWEWGLLGWGRGGDKMEPIGEEEEPEPHSPGSHKYWGFLRRLNNKVGCICPI